MAAKILVTGATGALGRLVVKNLVHRGMAVRAGVHRAERAEYVKMAGVEPVPLEFGDYASIDRDLEGVETLVLIIPNVREQVEFTRRMVDRSRLWGISSILKVSVYGANLVPGSQITRWHRQSELYLQDSTVPFIIVRPNALMQTFVRQVQPANSFLYMPLGQSRVSYLDLRDLAAFCAEVVLNQQSYLGQVLELTGPAALTMEEVAQTITETVGHHIGYIDTPEETVAHFLESTGNPDWLSKALAEFYSLWRDREFDIAVISEFERLLKRKPHTFAKFCFDYGAVLKAIVQQEHHTNIR